MRESPALAAARPVGRPSVHAMPAATAGAVVLLAAGVWLYALLVFVPAQQRQGAAAGVTAGPYHSDLYETWLGSREMLWQGRDPYSPAVTADIQRGFYGRPLTASDTITNTEQFVYPAYTAFLLVPLTVFPFEWVTAAFYPLALGLLALSVPLWLTGLRWRLAPGAAGLLALLGASTATGAIVVLIQQPTVLVAALLAGAAALLGWAGSGNPARRPWLYAEAGVLLALATVKPPLSVPLIGWLLVWLLGDWRRRQALAWGLGGALVLLAGGAWLLVPGWPAEWWAALTAFQSYAPGQSLLTGLLPPGWGGPALGALAGLIALHAWAVRRAEPGDAAFGTGLALALLFSVISYPGWAAYNQVILYPAALLVLQQAGRFHRSGAPARVVLVLAGALLLLPWALAPGVAGIWLGLAAAQDAAAATAAVTPYWAIPVLASFWMPFALLLPVLLLAGWTLRRPAAAEGP